MPRRIDLAGLALLAVALFAAWKSYDNRQATARWYTEVADYNRTITRFLVDHRDRLAGRPVAVYGVAAHSPWSLTAGGYLARLLGGELRWDVFVPAADMFYPYGALPKGTITVHPESRACEVAADPRTVHLVIPPEGRPRFADDCAMALALAGPQPSIDRWGPQDVSTAQRDAGFNMFFVGRDLLRGIEVRVAGRPTPMTHARGGELMTTSVPPQPGAPSIAFTVVRGERVLFRGTVAVR